MKKLQLVPIQPDMTQEINIECRREKMINSEYYSIYSDNTDIIFVDKNNSCESYQECKLSNEIIYHQSRNLSEFYKMIKLQTYLDNENRTKNNLINYNVKSSDSSLTISMETKDKLSSNR